MTEKEAIEKIKNTPLMRYEAVREQAGIRKGKLAEALEMGIKALEKQIPKKPIDVSRVRDGKVSIGILGRCPCCCEIVEEYTLHCDCGQRLDWGE